MIAAVDRHLAHERAWLPPRVEPHELAGAQADGALVIDIRPEADRIQYGELPGAHVVERIVLEWRLDPSSPDRLPQLLGPDQPVIVVCNEGYASSLAAAVLQRLGLRRATDLAGGFRAWQAAQASRPAIRRAPEGATRDLGPGGLGNARG